jgi:hypothetical protein
LTPGEFVVRAQSARANAGLLEEINAARGPVYRAGGGPVGREAERWQRFREQSQRLLEAGRISGFEFGTNARIADAREARLRAASRRTDAPASDASLLAAIDPAGFAAEALPAALTARAERDVARGALRDDGRWVNGDKFRDVDYRGFKLSGDDRRDPAYRRLVDGRVARGLLEFDAARSAQSVILSQIYGGAAADDESYAGSADRIAAQEANDRTRFAQRYGNYIAGVALAEQVRREERSAAYARMSADYRQSERARAYTPGGVLIAGGEARRGLMTPDGFRPDVPRPPGPPASGLAVVPDGLAPAWPLGAAGGPLAVGQTRDGITVRSSTADELRFGGGPLAVARRRKYAAGGLVAGHTTTDVVPALLQGGEFVMTRAAVRAVGADNLFALNQAARFADGGAVGELFVGGPGWPGRSVPAVTPQSPAAAAAAVQAAAIAPATSTQARDQSAAAGPAGMDALARALGSFGPTADKLATALSAFGSYSDKLAGVLEKLPESIEHRGEFDVRVQVTGTEAAGAIEASVKKLIDTRVAQSIDAAFERRMPDLPKTDGADPTRLR